LQCTPFAEWSDHTFFDEPTEFNAASQHEQLCENLKRVSALTKLGGKRPKNEPRR
jgi:hypothetical protein